MFNAPYILTTHILSRFLASAIPSQKSSRDSSEQASLLAKCRQLRMALLSSVGSISAGALGLDYSRSLSVRSSVLLANCISQFAFGDPGVDVRHYAFHVAIPVPLARVNLLDR